MSMIEKFEGKHVLVTGACGTIGSELVRQLADTGARRIVCLDNNESDLFFLQQRYGGNPAVECYLADIRDLEALKLRMQGVAVVLHAAALKHVGLCEDSPTQAVRTNIDGTQNVIDAALHADVERVLFTSSDKAVNPTNVMGTTKLMGERLMTAAAMTDSGTVFASTRFGNVLGSRGSVIPLFRKQIEGGGPVTLTDRRMTRFIMSLEEAAELVLRSVWLARGGEVFVTKMPVARIEDIALHMISEYGGGSVELKEIGAKPGEKMYEELMNEEEVRRTYEVENFFVVCPAFVAEPAEVFPIVEGHPKADRPYHSAHEPPMKQNELGQYLIKIKVN